MRKIEEKTGQLYIQQKFGGFCHLYIGQEAVVAGTASACDEINILRRTETTLTPLRCVQTKVAELYGKTTGMTKEKEVQCTCSKRK